MEVISLLARARLWHEKNLVADLRESLYDEEGNVLSEGEYGLVSSLEDSSEDDSSSIHGDFFEDDD